MAAPQVRRLGPAVEGFPVNSAERVADRLYLMSQDLSPALLLEYDFLTRRVTRSFTIPAGTRAWATAAAGGTLYLGIWNLPADQPNLYGFDVGAGRFRALARIPSRHEFWALDAAPDGTVYAGTDRTGEVFAYDPRTGSVSTIRFRDQPGSEVGAVAAAGDTVYVGTRKRGAGLLAIDRATGAPRPLLAPGTRAGVGVLSLAASDPWLVAGTDGPAHLVVVHGRRVRAVVRTGAETAVDAVCIIAGTVYATTKPAGILWRLDPTSGHLQELARPVASAPTRALLPHAGLLLGVSAAQTVWELDPVTGGLVTIDLLDAGAPARPLAVMSLAAAGGRVYVAASNRLQVHEPASGTLRRTVVPGEPKSALVAEGAVHLAVYPYAQLWRYRPDAAAPERLAAWDPDFNRPRDLAQAHDQLLVGTHSDRSRRGALVTFDLPSGRLAIHPQALDGQTVESVVAADGVAYLGGTGAQARLGAWDLTTRRALWQTVPAGGTGEITGLAVIGPHLHVLVVDGTYLVVDRRDGQVLHRARVLERPAGELAATPTGLYAASRDRLIRLDPRSHRHETLLSELDAQLFERPRVAVDEAGNVYLIGGSDLLRLTPTDHTAAGR